MMSEKQKKPQGPIRRWLAAAMAGAAVFLRRWWAAAVVVAAVILGGIGVIYLVGMPEKDAPPVEPTSSTGPSSKPSTPAAEGCNAPEGNFTEVPGDLDWMAQDGVTWPVSPSLGPTATEDGWETCFSRSPVGAALAATTMLFSRVDHTSDAVSEFYIVDSPGKATAVKESAGLPDLATQLEENGVQLVGFRVDEYTPDRTLVRLVVSNPNSQTGFVGLPYTMVWEHDDWRLKVLDDGTTGQAVPVNDGQFTRWTDG